MTSYREWRNKIRRSTFTSPSYSHLHYLQRREKYQNYADPGSVIIPEEDASSASFQHPSQRFAAVTIVEEERAQREAAQRRRAAEGQRRAQEEAARDAARFAAMAAESAAEEERITRLREHGGAARRNKSGMPFDPITLSYHASSEGNALR